MYSAKYLGKSVLLMTVTLMGVVSISLDGVTLTSKVNHLGQPTLIWSQQGKRGRGESVQLCGSRLVEAVRSLCRGSISGFARRSDPALSVYAGMSEERDPNTLTNEVVADVSGSSNGDMYMDVDNAYSDMEMMWPQNTKSLALKVLGENKGHQRFRRTIIDECCRKPCNVGQMLKYCS